MGIDWSVVKAAIMRSGKLKAVKNINITHLNGLRGLDTQKSELLANTRAFMSQSGAKAANHALLWGEMGCGKSSLVRAIFCEYMEQNLRLIELGKEELKSLHKVLKAASKAPKYRFIAFCDDFSFELNDSGVSELKRLLEGSIEAPPNNLLFYATTNRKHILKQAPNNNENYINERENSRESLSLADRFGLHLSFYELEMREYLALIDSLFSDFSLSQSELESLHKEAASFASIKGVRSARSAVQFYKSYQKLSKKSALLQIQG